VGYNTNMVKTLKLVLLFTLVVGGLVGSKVSAQGFVQVADYERAKVVAVLHEQGQADSVKATVLSGQEKGRVITAKVGVPPSSFDAAPPVYKKGDTVLFSRQISPDNRAIYVIVDHYRLSFALWLLIGIFILAIFFASWRGVGSLLGLILSILVLAGFVIPQIINGHNPYLVTAIGILFIAGIGIFVAHGFSKRTALALGATIITMVIAVLLAFLVVFGMHLTGITDTNTFYLSNAFPKLNMGGLLLCGMLISLIGILDDITVGQAASVEELYRANPKYTAREVYESGLKIGREHIASLINTLVLVFVGSSFIFITYLSAVSSYPWYVNLNSAVVMQEIARALVGSVALILAVPITTAIAAKFLKPSGPS
jgi:uncharacterized membrane protein